MADIDFKALEEKWRVYWDKEGTYKFNSKDKKKVYAIDTPPPTVSGNMHIGHAFSYSQQDFIARYKRMSGHSVFYPFGTDDNGLPTERLIERLKNVKSKEMSRADFIKLCQQTLKEITPAFVQDWKDLGISCDYSLSYSTIDEKSQKISQNSFVELYKKGLVYNAKFATIWCPECQTPIAQAELEDQEKETFFTTLRFQAQSKDLPIATTRPELLGACVAVFVNPQDKRYKSLVGKKAKVPIFKQEVPIIADESADMEKGSGVLMICSYGDKYDVEAIKRHKLEPKIVFTKDGKLTIHPYENFPIKDARKKILSDLKNSGLILEQKSIKHTVNTHDKCGTPIEFIPTKQWFIKILDNKKKLIEQGKKIKWFPEYMFKRYENWIQGLEWDWSISRERHFGIPIPAWHCDACSHTIVAEEKELPIDPLQTKKVCSKCKKTATPEEQVLDTWATSSLTPTIASSLVKNSIKLPYSLRPQAHDIIRTWAFYTIVKALYHENKTPWKDITISGFVTLQGQKMSKSKGNVISPQEVMKNYGADALRYWAASSKLGEDLDYQEKDLIAGKRFTTKIINAANFIFSTLQVPTKKPELQETDRLFLTQLNKVIESSTNSFEEYNYSRAKAEADIFFWKSFADNYLELVKNRVYNGSKEEKESAAYTLYHSFLAVLKLMAPFTPYITEEIYNQYFKKNEKAPSIHLSNWPEPIKTKENKKDDEVWNSLIEILSYVRQEKSRAQKSVKIPIVLTIPEKTQEVLKSVMHDLKSVTTAQEVKTGPLAVSFL